MTEYCENETYDDDYRNYKEDEVDEEDEENEEDEEDEENEENEKEDGENEEDGENGEDGEVEYYTLTMPSAPLIALAIGQFSSGFVCTYYGAKQFVIDAWNLSLYPWQRYVRKMPQEETSFVKNAVEIVFRPKKREINIGTGYACSITLTTNTINDETIIQALSMNKRRRVA